MPDTPTPQPDATPTAPAPTATPIPAPTATPEPPGPGTGLFAGGILPESAAGIIGIILAVIALLAAAGGLYMWRTGRIFAR